MVRTESGAALATGVSSGALSQGRTIATLPPNTPNKATNHQYFLKEALILLFLEDFSAFSQSNCSGESLYSWGVNSCISLEDLSECTLAESSSNDGE